MALDQETRALLGKLDLQQRDPEFSVPEQRRAMSDLIDLAGLPEQVRLVQDVRLPVAGGSIGARIYQPVPSVERLLVYFHGGGWVSGNRHTIDVPLRALANRSEWPILSVEYRLAPENKFPVPLLDCYEATTWALNVCASPAVAMPHLVVAGDSAGGNLAAAVALMARDRGSPKLTGQILLYPSLTRALTSGSYGEFAVGFFLTRKEMDWCWGQYLAKPEDGQCEYASPLKADSLNDLPPTLVITAEYDPLRDDGENYAARLLDAGVEVQLSRYEGTIHGFFQLGRELSAAEKATQEIAAFLRSLSEGRGLASP